MTKKVIYLDDVLDAIESCEHYPLFDTKKMSIGIVDFVGLVIKYLDIKEAIEQLPSAEQTLYGYKIEHLAYIAKVMEKEGVSAEYAVRTFDDMSRTMRMIIEEAQRKVEEALNG